MPTNIVITGVGGQGIILVTNIIAAAAHRSGLPVYVGEVHGMAQRGGTVISYLRMGEVYSSLVPEGAADIVLGMEIAETYRARNYFSPDTWVISNKRQIIPVSAMKDDRDYSSAGEIEAALDRICKNHLTVEADLLASKCGSKIVENVVMLGVMTATEALPLKTGVIREAVGEVVKNKWRELNLEAFNMGQKKGKELIVKG